MFEVVKVWKSFWNLKIQGVVKHFIWKQIHHLLPTKLNLSKRGNTNSIICLICECEAETSIHAIWSCSAAIDVWPEKESLLHKWSCDDMEPMELWKRINSALKENEIVLVANNLRKICL